MKALPLTIAVTLLNIKFPIIGNVDLLLVMSALIVVDLITGIIKAIFLKKIRTSEGYRKTVIKFSQYGGAIVAGFLMKYLAVKNVDLGDLDKYVDYLTNGLQLFIVFIELTSVFENLYQIDKTSPFSKYFLQPMLRILTFQLNKGELKIKDEHPKTEPSNEKTD
jgi:phage-related holin